MAVATTKDLAPPAGPAAPRARERDPEWWIQPVRWIALVIWLAVPVFTFYHIYRPWQAHVLWSVVIAGLPLFMLLAGYHRWRRICPLAFFSQIPTMLRRPGTRRASPWFEERYYYFMFALFFLALWLRLLLVNGVGEFTAAFFVLISFAALGVGALFTGKSWCNYFCPVSLIEKINTEPHGLRETHNSQCAKCTACKKSCPDINQENGYWKEIDLPSKRFAYYAYPGLLFGFFFYFWLQSGTWDYYFNGGWVDQPQLFSFEHGIYRAFIPDDHPMSFGFYFAPAVPRYVAALVTLAVGTAVGYLLFSRLEPLIGRWLQRNQPEADAAQHRHIMFTLVAFTGFMTFYAFAGQPLLRLLSWTSTLGGILAAVVGTAYIVRRSMRTQKAFAEQTVAQNIVKRWEWTDIRPPKDLHEAFLIHMARSTERKTGYTQVLEAYKEAIRETLAHGFVAREDIQRLESLRNQLQIKKADHEKMMASLAEEERALLADPSQRPSAEKLLQMETYRRALEGHLRLVLAAEERADDRLVRQLQKEYNVTESEHAQCLDAILGGAQGMAEQVAEGLQRDSQARRMLRVLGEFPSPVHDFLARLLRRKREQAVDRLLHVLHVEANGVEAAADAVRAGLLADDDATRDKALAALRARLAPGTAERLAQLHQDVPGAANGQLDLHTGLREYAGSPDPYVRATAIYALAEAGRIDLDLLRRLGDDDHELVRETLQGLLARLQTRPGAASRTRVTTLEKMIALLSVSIFASLEPESLAELARSSTEEAYEPGVILVREGESGEDAFIVLAGTVDVLLKADTPEEIHLAENSAGAIFGEMAVLDPGPRSATLRAGRQGVRVLRLQGTVLREVLRVDPTAAHGVIRTLVRRLRARLGQIGAEQESA